MIWRWLDAVAHALGLRSVRRGYDWVDDPGVDLDESLARLEALQRDETDLAEDEFDARAATGEPLMTDRDGGVA